VHKKPAEPKRQLIIALLVRVRLGGSQQNQALILII